MQSPLMPKELRVSDEKAMADMKKALQHPECVIIDARMEIQHHREHVEGVFLPWFRSNSSLRSHTYVSNRSSAVAVEKHANCGSLQFRNTCHVRKGGIGANGLPEST